MKLIDVLEKGERVGDLMVKGKTPVKGRLKGHQYMEIETIYEKETSFLMYLGIYQGKPPYYLPWIEWFSIEPRIHGGSFFDSDVERYLLELCSSSLPPGGRLFIDYSDDTRTLREMNNGVPPPLSRLGYMMFKNGFTWFKDWYFAEGFNEGSQKLQAEKALDHEKRIKHIESIRREISDYLNENEDVPSAIRNRVKDII